MVNILFYSGVTLGVVALALLGWTLSVRTTWGPPGSAPKEFVTRGPYRYIRHPGYTAQVTFYLAVGLVVFGFTEFWPILILTFYVFFSVVNAIRYAAKEEEDALRRVYGEEYLAYEQRSWRFLPLIY